jgi:hypothetical protein
MTINNAVQCLCHFLICLNLIRPGHDFWQQQCCPRNGFYTPPLEKVIAFCTAETNFVLHSKQIKNKDRKSSYYCQKVEILFSKSRPKFEKRREKVVIKFEKKAGQSRHKILKKGGKSFHQICFCLEYAFEYLCMLLHTFAGFYILLQAFTGFYILLQAFAYFCRLYILVQAFFIL